ncbi:MAG: 4-hydroxy-tetrahydrodipicolinate reductase [Clostridiales bacterium]|nr:4-hydroxy-tetrahydrodipicolinate reductase [Clostridiales bacterium]
MDILLVGYGRMGRLIADTVSSLEDCCVCGIIDIDDMPRLASMSTRCDVIIDFSHPDMLKPMAEYVKRMGVPVVSGTTNMTADDIALFDSLGEYAPVIHAANFSIGIAALKKAIQSVTPVLGASYDIEITEAHHKHKIDAPSGTAKMLFNTVNENGEYTPVYGRTPESGKREKKEVGIHALRGGSVAGEHAVYYLGEGERVMLSHSAEGRQVFVNGAIEAARRIVSKPNGVYTFEQLLFGE